ncbi:16S rRNA (uracil(1498)-N(3))-methyltransferase [Listeria aquatica]|uniref:16S rRNA (uracil(1498)-N(3))-methyltransferase n=1 Tax=Listeria aquatica TaxID=1494960 RepID=UPI003F7200BD
MQRYFIDQVMEKDLPVSITGDDFHHMVRVMRMKTGDEVWLVDSNEKVARATLQEILEDEVTLAVSSFVEKTSELPVEITVASGLPKGDKLDLIVQKGTELGAAQFLLFQAERSVTKWDEKKVYKKMERLERIAKEAAEQSHRERIPLLRYHSSLSALFKSEIQAFDFVVCAYEESAKQGESSSLARVFQEMPKGSRLLVIFGPEGGISEQEVTELRELDARFAGLGPRILRTETAPLYLLAAASFYFELSGKSENE